MLQQLQQQQHNQNSRPALRLSRSYSMLCCCSCCRVLYKLDRAGSGEEFSVIDLPNCTSLPLSGFTADQFVQLCVMAGCDFLAQLPGIGLKKAHGVLRKYRSFTKVRVFACDMCMLLR
jgi:5'-3' exonuclease